MIDPEDHRGYCECTQSYAQRPLHCRVSRAVLGFTFEQRCPPGLKVGGLDPPEIVVDRNHDPDDCDRQQWVESRSERGDENEQFPDKTSQWGNTRKLAETNRQYQAKKRTLLGETGIMIQLLISIIFARHMCHHAKDRKRGE